MVAVAAVFELCSVLAYLPACLRCALTCMCVWLCLLQVIDVVRDYNCTPDWVNATDDDRPCMQRALDAAAAATSARWKNQGRSSGSRSTGMSSVFVPRGTFHVRDTLKVPAGVSFIGSGKHVATITSDAQHWPIDPKAAAIPVVRMMMSMDGNDTNSNSDDDSNRASPGSFLSDIVIQSQRSASRPPYEVRESRACVLIYLVQDRRRLDSTHSPTWSVVHALSPFCLMIARCRRPHRPRPGTSMFNLQTYWCATLRLRGTSLRLKDETRHFWCVGLVSPLPIAVSMHTQTTLPSRVLFPLMERH